MNSNTQPKVFAVVPTYNMSGSLGELLPQLIEQQYDQVFVLDDASIDDTKEMVGAFGREVQLISGNKNVGSGANRNRIIGVLGALDAQDAIINFIDADTRLEPGNKPLAQAARDLFEQYPNAGMIGGKVLNADGSWGAFNYGPEFSLRWATATVHQLRLEKISKTDPGKALKQYNRHRNLLQGYPNIFQEPEVAKVGWLVETFNFVKAKTFIELGGYNPKLRYLEGLDFGARLEAKGLDRIFDPSTTVKHLQVDIRGSERYTSVLKAVARLAALKIFHR